MSADELNLKLPNSSDTSSPDCQPINSIQAECQKFDCEFLELLDSKSSSGRLLYVFIRRNLLAFGLSKTFKESFVLNESYLRGINQIKKGEVIQNIPAWLRSTAYNIVRELKREQQRSVPFEEYFVEVEHIPISLEDLEDDVRTLHVAFQLLDAEDKLLLNLKVIEGCSWKEIRAILRSEGLGDLSETTLRKRKERALMRLRKKYHQIKPPDLTG